MTKKEEKEEFFKSKPLLNERIGDKEAGKNDNADAVNLRSKEFYSCYDNNRSKTVLLSNEINHTIFSDVQLCSILDTIIYDGPDNNKNNINSILKNTEICDLQCIDCFFQLFGFKVYDKNADDIDTLFDLILPFDKKNEYIGKHLNYQKSFYMWLQAGFEKKDFKYEEHLKKEFIIEEQLKKDIDYLKNKLMDIEAFRILHNIGVSLKIKFTNVYIQTTDEFQIKAFEIGDPTAINRVFIGLYYNEGNRISFYFPILSDILKEASSQLAIKLSDRDCIKNFIFLPNYGPIYLQTEKVIDVPYFQSFLNAYPYTIDHGEKIQSIKMESKSFLNNDFPIFAKQYDKKINSRKITSLDKIRLFIQHILSNAESKNIDIEATENMKKVCQIVFEKVFKLPKENFATENSIKFTLDNGFEIPDLKRRQYLLHLMAPNDIISNLPIIKISSPLEIIDIMVTSLSRIFLIAKLVVNGKTNIFFGDGDFGSANLDDMFMCPTNIVTDQILSTFIFSGETKFDKDDIYCLPPGIIILHRAGDQNMITHYSRTDHIWKKEKEFQVPFEIKENPHVFFYSFEYVVFFQENKDGKFVGKSVPYSEIKEKKFILPKEENSKDKDSKEIEPLSVHFANGKIYFTTKENKIYKAGSKEQELEEEDRIKDLLIDQKEVEKNFKLFTDEVKDELLPVAIEINQKIHVFKRKSYNISSILYHPANKNSMLKYSILSMFYRYRRHINHEYDRSDKPYIIHANIDCSYYGNFGSIFKTSSSPGIYVSVITKKDPKYSYGYDWNDFPVILYTYFHNGKMQTGLTERRTLCQLAAAFACSYAISVYTSTGKVICYEPPNQNTSIWTYERCQKMEKNLIATYGTLLEMKNDYEFEFALSVLETTKDLIPDFKKFLHSLSLQ